jgi:hypothetical protein
MYQYNVKDTCRQTLKSVLRIELFLCIITAASCVRGKNDSNISIDIEKNINNLEEIYLSDYCKSIKYVVLENRKDLPLAWISQIDFNGNKILVTDMKNCLLYNSEGRFINKIGSQGRGPGEYEYVVGQGFIQPGCMFIHDIFDMLEYTESGLYIRKHKIFFMSNNDENEPVNSFLVIDDSLFFGHVSNTTGEAKLKAVLKSKNGAIVKTFKNYVLFKRKQPVFSGFEDFAHIYRFNGSVFYKEFYNDTLFRLDKGLKLVPEYNFYLGKYKEPLSTRELVQLGLRMQPYIYIWNVFQTKDLMFLVTDFTGRFPVTRRTPRTIMGTITSMYNTTKILGVFDRKTKTLTFSSPTCTDNPLFTSGLYNDIDGGPKFMPVKQINDSTMVMWIKPEELIAHIASDDFRKSVPKYPEKKKALEEMVNRLTILDNPVLMYVTFKK